MLKKIISLAITVSMLMSAAVVFAEDDDTETDASEFDAMQEIENNADVANESENNTDMYFESVTTTLFIPDYDKSGMTDYEIIMKNIYCDSLQQLGSVKNIDANIDSALADYREGGYFYGPNYWAYEPEQLANARHFRYLMHMVAGYRMPESKYYHSQEIWDKMHECIDFWMNTMTRKYVYPGPSFANWWACTIGRGIAIMPFLALAKGCIEDDILIELTEEHLYAARQMGPGLCTGTNAVWYAKQSIVKGAMLNDSSLIEEGAEIIRETMELKNAEATTNAVVDFGGRGGQEGIQVDGSYHMHGPKYYANYANSFEDFAIVNMYFKDTQFEMDDMYDLIIDTVIDGWAWICRGPNGDVHQNGRVYISGGAPIYQEGKMNDGSSMWITMLERMEWLYPERSEDIEQAIKYLLPYNDPEREHKIGNKYFYRSDYMTHHRAEWTAWTQMNSWRTYASEHNTVDAVEAYWFGFGSVFLDKGDDLYAGSIRGLPLFWDQTKIPGTTASEYVHLSNKSGETMSQTGTLVGGVSDGMYGMNAMYLAERAGVTAKKAWFWFDDEYVALGSGITSTSKYNTNTTVDNRRLTTDIEVDGKVIENGKYELKDVSSVLQYGIGYVFPDKEDIVLEAGKVTGNYTKYQKSAGIDNTDYTTNMMTLYIPHGKYPKNDTYEYICVPDTDSEHLAEYVENNPIEIAENTPEIQAVLQKELNIAGAVFYVPSKVSFSNGLAVESDSICCFMAREADKKLKLYVSNPYQGKTTVTLNVTYNGKTEKVKFELPGIDAEGYNYGGKTIEKDIEL